MMTINLTPRPPLHFIALPVFEVQIFAGDDGEGESKIPFLGLLTQNNCCTSPFSGLTAFIISPRL